MKFNAEDITSFLTFRYPLNTLKKYNYPYTISFEEQSIDFDAAKAKAELLLINAIEKHMDKSDKPAVMMSAGLDSVLLTALMKHLEPDKKIRLYTAKFDVDSEYVQAKQIAKYFNLPHALVEICPSNYLIPDDFLIPLTQLKKEPLHPNEIALAKTEMKAKEDGCDVVFCGEGADDVFGGYDKLLTFYKKHQSTGKDFFLADFLEFYRYFSLSDREQIIKPSYLVDDVDMLLNSLGPPCRDLEFRELIFYFIQKVHTPGLLKRGMNAIRYNELDAAFPYIDKELSLFVNSLPFEYKIFGNTSKYILREIASKYIPHDFAYAEKHPFPVPFEQWLKDTNKWSLNKSLFLSNDISSFDGWHKWMLINLNTWLEECQKQQ